MFGKKKQKISKESPSPNTTSSLDNIDLSNMDYVKVSGVSGNVVTLTILCDDKDDSFAEYIFKTIFDNPSNPSRSRFRRDGRTIYWTCSSEEKARVIYDKIVIFNED